LVLEKEEKEERLREGKEKKKAKRIDASNKPQERKRRAFHFWDLYNFGGGEEGS